MLKSKILILLLGVINLGYSISVPKDGKRKQVSVEEDEYIILYGKKVKIKDLTK